jgi:hypothetical protein
LLVVSSLIYATAVAGLMPATAVTPTSVGAAAGHSASAMPTEPGSTRPRVRLPKDDVSPPVGVHFRFATVDDDV